MLLVHYQQMQSRSV